MSPLLDDDVNPISVSPSTKQDEREVYGVEEDERAKRVEMKRQHDERYPLEAVRWLTAEAKQEFRDIMATEGIAEDSDEWRKHAKEYVERLWAEMDDPSAGTTRGEQLRKEPAGSTEGEPDAKRTRRDGAAASGTETKIDEPGEQEGRSLKPQTQPYVPTAAERREHRKTHYPPRSWCKHCVEACGMAAPHLRCQEDTSDGVGELHFDYCFLRNRVADDPAVTLVGVDKSTQGVLAHVVPGKGTAFDWVAAQLDRDVRKWGYHGRVVVKSDGEPAIVDLMKELALRRKESPTVIERSKAHDSMSNGRAENAVRRVESLVRTMKLAAEEWLQEELDVHAPIFSWLVEHAADVLTKCAVGADGRTPYERIKGKRYHGTMMEFGSVVSVKYQGKLQGGLMKERWGRGIWIGKRWTSDEHLVCLPSGRVVRARDVRAVPEDESYDKGLFLGVRGTPSNPSAVEGDAGVLREVPRPPVERTAEPVSVPIPRQVILHRSYFQKFGFTEGCQKCRAILRGDDANPTLAHNAECRTRIEGRMEEDAVLKPRLEAARQRRDRYFAEEMERTVGPRPPQTQSAEASSQMPSSDPTQMAPDVDDDKVPEFEPEDECEPESKRARVESQSERSPETAEAEAAVEVEESVEPPEKRQRAGTLSAVVDPQRERWADMDEGESALEVGMFSSYRCDHCDLCFASRNQLFHHLKSVGRAPEEGADQAKVGSVRGSRPSTEDAAGEAINSLDSSRKPRAKPRKLRNGENVYDVCEVFSPPRTTSLARKLGLRGGWALDVASTCPITGRKWDCLKEEDRAWGKRMLHRDKPKLLVVSPPCTLFSQLQNLSPNGLPQVRCPEEYRKAILMVEYAVELCRIQMRAGRAFIFEHPRTASSWELEALRSLMAEAGVRESVFDMCCFGMMSEDSEGPGLVRKTTRILTNADEIVGTTMHRCRGGHRHVPLVNGRAKACAEYPLQLCEAFLKGLFFWDRRKNEGTQERCLLEFDRADLCDPEEEDIGGRYMDDLKGDELDPTLARKARAEEMEVFRERRVYDLVALASLPRGTRIVGTRWVETNKGTAEKPKVRSRLVCQEFNLTGDPSGELFAPTPPLGATRYLMSALASRGIRGTGSHRAMFLDFKRAFLYGDCERDVYIKVPSEDPDCVEGVHVGKLRKAMYGTRDAPAVWQKLVRKTLLDLGFEASRTSACVYVHHQRQVKIVAHVDDFLCTGPKVQLLGLRDQLKANFEVDGDILGPGEDEVRNAVFLGRRFGWRPWGFEIEADGRLVKGLLSEFAAEIGSPLEVPGSKDENEGTEPMTAAEAARFRRGAAKFNYLSQDRADLSYASKEVSRHMARPMRGDEMKLLRVLRYLSKYPSWVATYKWQEDPKGLTAYTDSDWGGCCRTRRSTSGGVILHGAHNLLHWSRTQQLIALSSAEAELNASIKAGQEGLGLKHLAAELGDERFLCIRGDSSANDGIIKRAGAGKIKHLSVRQLWLQEQSAQGILWHEKIPRAENCADALTHHFSRSEAEIHFRKMGCQRPQNTHTGG